MKKILLTLFIIVLTIQLKNSYSFWSDPFYQTHQDITKIALTTADPRTGNPPYCFSGNCFYFSDSATVSINARHLKQDTGAYDPDDHFDANQLVGALTKLAGNRSQLNYILNTKNFSFTTQLRMWALMGNMLHAVEDFYAHSTWVDEGKTSIIDFGTATENYPPDTSIFPSSPVEQFCNPAGPGYPLSALPVNYLITGFYPYPPGSPELVYGGCLHGKTSPSLFGGPSTLFGLCYSSQFTLQQVPGISHDVACSGNFSPANTEQLHDAAYGLAVREARSFVQAIVDDLVTANNPAGFCALLDVPLSEPICGFVGTVSGTLPLQLQGGLTFPDGSTLNTVSFGVSIDVNGIVSAVPVPIMDNGTTLTANNFLTNCPVGPATGTSTCVPFGKSYDWPLNPTALCLGDGKNACGPVGSATLTLAYTESGSTPDGPDHCNITVNLTNVAGSVNAVAVQGACNYVGKGISTLLISNKAVCFNEPTGMVCP